jgi:hypothetical protein
MSPVETTSVTTPSAEASPAQSVTAVPVTPVPSPAATEEEKPKQDERWFMKED